MANTLETLTDHLFTQLARLNDPQLDDAALHAEIARAGAMGHTAREIIAAGRLAVDAAKARADFLAGEPGPSVLGLGGGADASPPRPHMISGGR
ncbi:hypothetical protein [uncultured Lamprocystis sp.]|jgi:hypothetical protein|uniref:hypothetical protein n=1 Tax=uncultured Lamprocystis sp. TaxID=543132 RepID=UPI0025DAB078|nr:hypothetical protein [uncultured Lamprocystis sp.]